MTAAHLLIERRLDERERRRNLGRVLRAMPHQRLRRRGILGIRRQPHDTLASKRHRILLQLLHRRIQILRIPRIQHPYRLPPTPDPRPPATPLPPTTLPPPL